MARFRIKSKWKNLLCGVLVVLTIFGACAGLAVLSKKDTKEIGAGAFTRGALDENGIYVASEQSIYTKEAFGCIGLRVEPDFEAQATYDVYYYDSNGRMIESVKGLDGIYDEDYPLAQYARVVIHPEIPDGVLARDFKIGYFDVRGYAKDFTITVNKNQNYLYKNSLNLYVEDNATVGSAFDIASKLDTLALTENANAKVTEEIAISGEYEKYDIYVRCSEVKDVTLVAAVATTADNKFVVREGINIEDLNAGEWCKLTIEVSEAEEAAYLRATMPVDAECYIFGYND